MLAAEAYHGWTMRIVGGDLRRTDVFYQSPLYPSLLAIVYAARNGSPATIRLVQAPISNARENRARAGAALKYTR